MSRGNYAGSTLVHPAVPFYRSAANALLGTEWPEEVMFADLSFYDGDVDFEKLRYRTPMVILRAGQANYEDSRYTEFNRLAKEAKLKRSAYWYYDDRFSWSDQAHKAIEVIGTAPELPIFVDWENSFGGPYSTIQHVIEFMKLVEEGLNTKCGVYTGYYWFKDNATIAFPDEEEYLASRPLWLAWYAGSSKDVRVPAPWTKPTFWQWGVPDWAKFMGTSGDEVDMNYYVGTWPEFIAEFGPDATEWVQKLDGDGITRYEAYTNGAFCSFFFCDPKKVRFEVTGSFAHVLDAIEREGAFAGVNGDGWGSRTNEGIPAYKPNSIACSNGRYTQLNQFETRPWIDFPDSFEDIPFIRHTGYGNLFNAVSGDRYLVQHGIVNPALVGRYSEKNARTCVGLTSNGKIVVFINHGWDRYAPDTRVPPQGLGWVELAEVLRDIGCHTAINLDGGGSTTMGVRYKGTVRPIGIANDDGLVGSRSVVNQLLMYVPAIPEPTPPTGGEMDAIVKCVKEIRIRDMPNFYGNGAGDLPIGTYKISEIEKDTKPVLNTPFGDSVVWYGIIDPDGTHAGWVPDRDHTKTEPGSDIPEALVYMIYAGSAPEPPVPVEPDNFLEPITLEVEGKRYRTVGDKIPLEEEE